MLQAATLICRLIDVAVVTLIFSAFT